MAKAYFRRTSSRGWHFRVSELSIWQQLFYLSKKFTRSYSTGGFARWLISSLGVSLMLLWNWKLSLATASGIGIMLVIYLAPSFNWQSYLVKLHKFLSGFNRRLIVAVSGGSLAAFGTYLSASIWADSENSWLATSWILQALLSFTTFLILVWHIITSRGNGSSQGKYEQFVEDLTHKDSLRRLIAIRQLTSLVNRSISPQRLELVEYFHLMLEHEPEPIIKEALLESLHKLDHIQPLNIPIKFKSVEQSVFHSEQNF